MGTKQYHHYLTRSWRHLLPERRPTQRLDSISQVIRDFDLVCLQEVDGGSLRSGFVNQLEYLAEASGFKYSFQQLNRDLGRLGQYSNGVLSKFVPLEIEDHKLPGLRGRGAIVAKYGSKEHHILLVGLHLALTPSSRNRQLAYVKEIVSAHKHVIVMGDLNCGSDQLFNSALKDTHLIQIPEQFPTYPSWNPKKHIDHILVSPSLAINRMQVLACDHSDHCPIAMEIQLPPELITPLTEIPV